MKTSGKGLWSWAVLVCFRRAISGNRDSRPEKFRLQPLYTLLLACLSLPYMCYVLSMFSHWSCEWRLTSSKNLESWGRRIAQGQARLIVCFRSVWVTEWHSIPLYIWVCVFTLGWSTFTVHTEWKRRKGILCLTGLVWWWQQQPERSCKKRQAQSHTEIFLTLNLRSFFDKPSTSPKGLENSLMETLKIRRHLVFPVSLPCLRIERRRPHYRFCN